MNVYSLSQMQADFLLRSRALSTNQNTHNFVNNFGLYAGFWRGDDASIVDFGHFNFPKFSVEQKKCQYKANTSVRFICKYITSLYR